MKHIFRPGLVTLFILLSFFPNLNLRGQSDRFEAKIFIRDSDTLRYRQLWPDANPYEKYPLVIFLHGAGERGKDNNAQLKWGVTRFASDEMMARHPAIVIAPQCPRADSWWSGSRLREEGRVQFGENPTQSLQSVLELINELKSNNQVDTNRIYITGLSMGGLGTFEAIQRFPGWFAAAIPVAGGGDPMMADRIKDMPLWVVHGADDAVVDPRFSRQIVQAIQELGGRPGYSEYPSTGHFSWLAAYSDPHIIEWMFRQRKK